MRFDFTQIKQLKSISVSLIIFLSICVSTLSAQNNTIVRGVIVDTSQEPIIGASVVLKSNASVGTITDINGRFSIEVPSNNPVLIVSYIGMETQEFALRGRTNITVEMKDNNLVLEEVVVVGFGQQKKSSIVGSIVQTGSDKLERTGGISSLGAALTGNLPGVVTISSTGQPGDEDPRILIRAASSWNNSEPLVLIDGIERSLSSVDINSVETISVLKDASATAVFGVKGANGVILVTTKRGSEGKARIDVGFSSTVKTASKLPGKLDAYDAYMLKNRLVEYELASQPNAWAYITPQSTIENYRNQTTQEQRERYPNIDWVDYLFKDFAMSYNTNINISGGTNKVKYFSALDYQYEGDLFDVKDNNRGYNTGFGFNRLNTRTNLDFKLTKTTTFKVNLFGSYGVKQAPWSDFEYRLWDGAYSLAPDVYYPRYSDGAWGYYAPQAVDAPNSAMEIATKGLKKNTTTRLNTDFSLQQDLGFILKGLSLNATLSWDFNSVEVNKGIRDNSDVYQKYIDPKTGVVTVPNNYDGNTNFDWQENVNWTTQAGEMENWNTRRNLRYQAQLNYGRTFGKHNVTAMGNVAREERATGGSIPSYREDWVFRTTYGYGGKYFAEYNGAYNGSEKFSPEYRFAFFSSGAVGWMLSEEKFMKSLTFLDLMKLRASYGQIGDDNVGDRWLYMTLWNYGGTSWLGDNENSRSPYTWFTLSQLGNPDIHWETVTKRNYGVDFSIFGGLFSGAIDVFHDNRTEILINGNNRAIPSYLGVQAPWANLGKVEVKGYELELKFNKVLPNKMRIWANASMTHAEDRIIERDDPQLLPAYRKQAGYAIGQTRTVITHGYYNTPDELYATTKFESHDANKMIGNYQLVDFNGDGIIDENDKAPTAYSSNPQNTYNTTLGLDYKGFSMYLQFYGVSNVSRWVGLTSFGRPWMNTAYSEGELWSKENTNPDAPNPTLISTNYGDYRGDHFLYDGSYVRLKNAELSYTFDKKVVGKVGLNALRIYLNGNNLLFWSHMPDDRESNVGGWRVSHYPTMKRFNLGMKVTF